MAFVRKETSKSQDYQHSYVVPLTKSRKEQLTREINEMFEGKRKGVKACVAEIIELLEEEGREKLGGVCDQ